MPKPLRRLVPIITDLAKLPEPVRRHLEYRLNEDIERKLTPRELAQLKYWTSSSPHAYAGEDWARDFGTFYTVGRGELWKSIITNKKNSQGIWVRMRPREGDRRLAAIEGWLDSYKEWGR